MPKHNKAADLLKVLGQRTPPPGASKVSGGNSGRTPKKREPVAKPSAPRASKPKGARGKAIQFYLHTEDEKLIREFAVWLAPHRKRINDSLVIKAVLRAAKTGPALLDAYDEGLAISKAHKRAERPQEYQ